MVKQIKVGKYVALVDDEDYEKIAKHVWCASKSNGGIYAQATINYKHVSMHQLIMNVRLGVDHIDGNKLNNTRSNLRIATRSQNQGNKKKTKSETSSKYKGVTWYERLGKWGASITKNYKRRSLGFFEYEEDAALAYDEAARAQWGEFARVNFPKDREQSAI